MKNAEELKQKISDRFLETLTKADLKYCNQKQHGEYRGFSALHDKFCANEHLLYVIEELGVNLQSDGEGLFTDDTWNFLNSVIEDIDNRLKI